MVTDLNEDIQEVLTDRLHNFVEHLDVKAYTEFGEYRGFAVNRKILFKEGKEYDSTDHFWDVAKIHFKELPDVGKNLLQIPAHFPNVDLLIFYELSKKYAFKINDNLMYDFNVMLKNIRL